MLDGTIPYASDQLKRWLRNGARTSAFVLSSEVGRGSDRDCLSGSDLINSTTSVGVIGANSRSSQPTGAAVKHARSAPAVADRTPATFASKKSWRTDASMSVGGTRPRPSSWSISTRKRGNCKCIAT